MTQKLFGPNYSRPIEYGAEKVARMTLYGSLGVSIALTIMLIGYDLFFLHEFRISPLIGLIAVAYLLQGLYLTRRGMMRAASWELVIFYLSLASLSLLFWGLDATAGIFAMSFVIILTGILLGNTALIAVTITIALILLCVQYVHALGFIIPDNDVLSNIAPQLNVMTYITILGIFTLITWVSRKQIEESLERAHQAEARLRVQKNSLALALKQQSTRLRESQLNELRQLYKFASLGQTTAATLHELSNLLSILNLDIDDLKQQDNHSVAIKNAQESIKHINAMVTQTRQQLNNYDTSKKTKVTPIIDQVIKDVSQKASLHAVSISFENTTRSAPLVRGDPLALAQALTILVNNAIEASVRTSGAKVTVILASSTKHCTVTVVDNGPGFNQQTLKSLFSPLPSMKPTGLGVGLYIAHNIAESHLRGSLTLLKQKRGAGGARLRLTIPLYSKAT